MKYALSNKSLWFIRKVLKFTFMLYKALYLHLG